MNQISSTGRQPSWDPMTLPLLAVFSSWTSTSLRITPSNHQSSSSSLKYTTPTSTPTVVFVSTSWRISGRLRSLFLRCSYQSAPYWLMPTPTILSFPTSHLSSNRTEQSTRPPHVNGPASTLCEVLNFCIPLNCSILIIFQHFHSLFKYYSTKLNSYSNFKQLNFVSFHFI